MTQTEPPFFIVGCPRSGTTLLRVILDRHPEIAIPPESHFIPRHWARRRRYGSNDRVDDVELFLQHMSADRRFREWGVPIQAVRERIGKGGSNIRSVIETVYLVYANSYGKRRWGDKTPEYIDEIPLLSHLFPGSRFVHLIRDGRDVSLSMLDLEKRHKHVASAACIWARTVERGRKTGSRLGPERYMEIRYEDLLDDAESELNRLSRFLDFTFEPAMLNDDGGALNRVPSRKRQHHTRLGLPPTKGLRDWRKDMSPVQIAECEAVAGDVLTRCGYELTYRRVPLARVAAAWTHVGGFAGRELNRRLQRGVLSRRGAGRTRKRVVG